MVHQNGQLLYLVDGGRLVVDVALSDHYNMYSN